MTNVENLTILCTSMIFPTSRALFFLDLSAIPGALSCILGFCPSQVEEGALAEGSDELGCIPTGRHRSPHICTVILSLAVNEGCECRKVSYPQLE
jgi:hypothetical protein